MGPRSPAVRHDSRVNLSFRVVWVNGIMDTGRRYVCPWRSPRSPDASDCEGVVFRSLRSDATLDPFTFFARENFGLLRRQLSLRRLEFSLAAVRVLSPFAVLILFFIKKTTTKGTSETRP